MTKVFVLVKQSWEDCVDPILEVDAYPTLDAAVKYIHDFYFDDGNEDVELWNEMKTELTTKGSYVDTDGNDQVQWDIYEREF